jgi:hypothetical protein
MKKVLITLIITLTSFFGKAQTCIDTIAFDNMETFNWFGNWWRTPPATTTTNTGFFNNASVSPNLSARIFGAGSASSGSEQDWYVMPNITGLNPTSTHRFSFRLASYVFSSPMAATRGVDATGGFNGEGDFVEVQLSTDGEVTYFGEMRIRGFGNATWDYNTLGFARDTANGVLRTFTPTAGGNRTTTGDGFSVIQLTIPPGPTQIAVDILCRVNSAGEEWWIDNVMLEEIYNCTIFPIELIEFDSKCENGTTLLYWSTMTELDNDYFTLEKSIDGINWSTLKEIDGAGTSNEINNYSVIDNFPSKLGNYYRLTQTDYNGDSETFNVIYSDCYRGFISEGISIYPVPVKSTLNIEVDVETYSQEKLEYKIYNIFGIVVSSGVIDTSKNKITSIDVNEWVSGTYTVVIGTEFRKIVIQK